MAFDFKGILASSAAGEHMGITTEGMTVNGEPVMFQYDEHVFVKDVCIMTKKRLQQLISSDGIGVQAREEARKVFESAE